MSAQATHNGLPVFECDLVEVNERGGRQIRLAEFFCPECFRVHTHGWPPGSGTGPSHRVAHCTSDSTLLEQGYYLHVPEVTR